MDTAHASRKVVVSRTIAEQLEEVRLGGACNMLDRLCVQAVAADLELLDLFLWIEDNRTEYGRAILGGFEIESA